MMYYTIITVAYFNLKKQFSDSKSRNICSDPYQFMNITDRCIIKVSNISINLTNCVIIMYRNINLLIKNECFYPLCSGAFFCKINHYNFLRQNRLSLLFLS